MSAVRRMVLVLHARRRGGELSAVGLERVPRCARLGIFDEAPPPRGASTRPRRHPRDATRRRSRISGRGRAWTVCGRASPRDLVRFDSATMTRTSFARRISQQRDAPASARHMVDDKKAALARLKASRQSRRAEGGAPEWNATPEPPATARCVSPSVRAANRWGAHPVPTILNAPPHPPLLLSSPPRAGRSTRRRRRTGLTTRTWP